MRKTGLLLALLMAAVAGCASDKDLLLEMKKHLIENVRPNYAAALQESKTPDGKPLYIEIYKTTQMGVVDQMIDSIDRVYPPEKKTELPALPWVKAAVAPVATAAGTK
jgi:hypothetical protein